MNRDDSPVPSSIRVRNAIPADGDAFLALVDALAEYEHLSPPDAAAKKRLIQDALGPRARFRLLLAEIDEPDGPVVAGYAVFFDTYSTFLALPTLYLEDVFVLPQFRARGAGRALFAACVRQAWEQGYGRMEWSVLTWNQPAIDFYERRGARRLSGWQYYRLTRDEMQPIVEG